MQDYSGWLWVVMDVVAVVVLGLALVYAGRRYVNRNRAKDGVADLTTRRNYAEEDRAAAHRGET